MAALTIKADALKIHSFDAAHQILTLDAPMGWADVKHMTRLVLEYDGHDYVWTGWNSDRNLAYFKRAVGQVAMVKGLRRKS